MMEQEMQLVQLAKKQYSGYPDVKRLAQIIGLKAGEAYHILKKHSFIRQNETTEYRVAEAYFAADGNLREITKLTQLSVWICSQTLKKIGLKIDFVSYRNGSDDVPNWRLAEEEFGRLVANAVDMNRDYQYSHPVFDFVFNDKTIDVKCASFTPLKSDMQGSAFYKVVLDGKTNHRPDYYCLFLICDNSKPLQAGNYRILLLPSDALPQKRYLNIIADPTVNRSHSKAYWDFEVEPSALHAILATL